MRQNTKNLLLLFIMVLNHTFICMADDKNDYASFIERITPHSPQIEMMMRFGSYPIDYATGVPSITIPIYSIECGDLKLPVSIDYHASGIKVKDVASAVGLGWMLNCGGVICRQQLGGADRDHEYRYTSAKQISESYKNTTDRQWRELSGNNFENIESDRYTYNFCGKSGVFRYSFRDKKYKTIPYDDIRIENIGKSDKFKITTNDGTQYYFEESSSTSGQCGKSIWFLTKIVSLNGHDSITLNYSYHTAYNILGIYEMEHIGEHFYLIPIYGTNDAQEWWDSYKNYYDIERTLMQDYIVTPLLSCVSWNGNKINFEYEDNRKDLDNRKLPHLTRIKIINSENACVRNVRFYNNRYLGTNPKNYRMLLDSISFCGKEEAKGDMTYSFSYDMTALPDYVYDSRAKCSEDYWGYYNGTFSYDFIPKEFALSGHDSTAADRNVYSQYTQAGILKRIVYPTGGSTHYEYENNSDGERLCGGLRIKSIKDYEGSKLLHTKSYEYERPVSPVLWVPDMYRHFQCYYYYTDDKDEYIYIPMFSEHEVVKSEPVVPINGDYGYPVYYQTVIEKTMKDNEIIKTHTYKPVG